MTSSETRESGRAPSMTNRVARSTRVMIAELPRAPMTRSPSQCPGTARSATSAGRVEMWKPRIQGLLDRSALARRDWGRRAVRPDRSATWRASSSRIPPRAW